MMKSSEKIVSTVRRTFICSILCILMTAGITYAASIKASVGLTTSDTSVTSDAVGLGTEATFYGRCYSKSTTSMTMKCMACWDGWPYSTEASETIKPEQTRTVTDTQSKSSSFKVKLSGGKTTCSGAASVTLTKY